MNDKCLAGINRETGVLEIIASLKSHVNEHLEEIAKRGCYAIVGDTEKVKAAWGTVIDDPLSLIAL